MSTISVSQVGNLTGQNGKGIVYQLEENGKKTLAMIWTDGKFHELTKAELLSHVSQGKAEVTGTLSDNYQSFDLNTVDATGYKRLYEATTTGTDQTESTANLKIKIPYSVTGELTLDISQLKDLFNILTTE